MAPVAGGAPKRATTKKTTPRKPAAKKPKPIEVEVALTGDAAPQHPGPLPLTEEERQAKLTAYSALRSVGLPIPEELATEVEGWIADYDAAREAENATLQTEAEQIAEENKNGPWYVRNGYPAPFNFRLDRQTEKRRIELKPRGTPGDLHPLQDDDLKDPVLRRNVAIGLLEVIPAGEANIIIAKQTTNMGQRIHTPINILRNELGQPYQQGAVRVEAEFNSQGVTVATLDPNQLQGHVHDKDIGGRGSWGGLQRVNPKLPQGPTQPGENQATSIVSGFVPTGGNPAIISQGGIFADNARAKAVDDLARRKGLQGPAAGLGGVTVTVEPTVKT
jgi:hypothetical protein